MTDAGELVTMTADIVAAHISNNPVAIADLPALIGSVHAALTRLEAAAAEMPAAKREPVVSVRASVKADAIACLICGGRSKMLKRHLMTAHGLTPAEYREEFKLRDDYPMVAPDYAEQRRALAKKIGLGTRANQKNKRPRKAK